MNILSTAGNSKTIISTIPMAADKPEYISDGMGHKKQYYHPLPPMQAKINLASASKSGVAKKKSNDIGRFFKERKFGPI